MTKPKAIIVDLDGTLCNHKHRLHFVDPNIGKLRSGEKWKPDYESFYAAMDKDTVNEWCSHLLLAFDFDEWVSVLFVTGRPEKYRDMTVKWLISHLGPYQHCSEAQYQNLNLFMRPDCLPFECACSPPTPCYNEPSPDHRPSHVVKREIFEQNIAEEYDILFALEDDEECARMYRELGLTVLVCR